MSKIRFLFVEADEATPEAVQSVLEVAARAGFVNGAADPPAPPETPPAVQPVPEELPTPAPLPAVKPARRNGRPSKVYVCDDFPGQTFTAERVRTEFGLAENVSIAQYARRQVRVRGRHLFRPADEKQPADRPVSKFRVNCGRRLACDDFPGRTFTQDEVRKLGGLSPTVSLAPYVRDRKRVGGRHVFRWVADDESLATGSAPAPAPAPAAPTSTAADPVPVEKQRRPRGKVPTEYPKSAAGVITTYDLGGARTRGEAFADVMPINPNRLSAAPDAPSIA